MNDTSRHIIIANPVSGTLSANRRWALLKTAADRLQAPILGMDANSPAQLAQCARDNAQPGNVLVVAGGDGTMSLVINAIGQAPVPLAFLPFGTGNALTHALAYRGDLQETAARIRNGRIFQYDLIDCSGRKRAFMTSLGIDGAAIRNYEAYRRAGLSGWHAHARAVFKAGFRDYHAVRGQIAIDDRLRSIARLTSFMVVKQPFFGMGLKVVPQARWDDGLLHSRRISSGLPGVLAGLATGFTVGTRVGEYRAGKRIAVRLEAPLTLQIDGEVGWTDRHFTFRVLPGALRLKH